MKRNLQEFTVFFLILNVLVPMIKILKPRITVFPCIITRPPITVNTMSVITVCPSVRFVL